jgi:oxygen-independent coproporphyrinogen III oxidase
MTPDLIARCEQRVPRYTSYPTAPHFTSEIGPESYAAWLGGLAAGTETSLYLHVPFCAELCLYCGCHTTVARRYGPIAAYVDLLEREIDLVAEQLQAPLAVRHIHWGGGTPTILTGSDLLRLTDHLGRRFGVESGAEIAVEIDPRTVTPAMVETLAAAGISRASLGVQSFEPVVQQTIRRVQSFAETHRVAEWLRFAGIEAINLDIMYGLPFQTVENVVATVVRALDLDPDRLALFGYAHVPWMRRHQALLPQDAMPNSAERLAQFEAAAQRIVEAGYVRVGLDHFAKAEDPLAEALSAGALRRNFQGYTTDAAPALIGFGASAISRLPAGYAQNAATTVDYRAQIARGSLATARGLALTQDDLLRGEVIERLMCDFHVDLAEICRRHGADPSLLTAELAKVDALADDGLALRRGTRISVPDHARSLVRVLCAAFDARLSNGPGRHAAAV